MEKQDESREPDSSYNRRFEVLIRCVVAAALIAAFTAQGLLRFVPPPRLWLVGGWLAAGTSLTLAGFYFRSLVARFLGDLVMMGTLGYMLIISFAAMHESETNDRRCLAIQRDMLSARPRRADGPDLFQALGCRPQGEGSVYAQKAVERE